MGKKWIRNKDDIGSHDIWVWSQNWVKFGFSDVQMEPLLVKTTKKLTVIDIYSLGI